MKRTGRSLALLALVAVVGALSMPAVATERKDIPEKLTWNLADLYPTEAAWEQAKANVEKRIPEMAPFKGHLGDSAGSLYKALSTMADLDKELVPPHVLRQPAGGPGHPGVQEPGHGPGHRADGRRPSPRPRPSCAPRS